MSILLLGSCRTEETISEGGFTQDAKLANLIERTSLNDGSTDNIIDKSNCFTVQLPVTVIVNGLEIIADSKEDFDTIEAIFDELDDDDDKLQIEFPITIVLSDFTEIRINNQNEFDDFSDDCNGENEPDDDIECIDFKYPIQVSVFNTISEQRTSVTINSDKEMHDFIHDLDDNDVADIQFPLTLILFDASEVTVTSLDALEDFIDDAEDDCDEDDDFDFDDDDCQNCTEEQVLDILTACTDWSVDKLELNDNDLEDNYIGYTFNFSTDGTVTVQNSTETFSGTWSASGSGQSITVIIDISSLPDFNASWNLHEIEQSGTESKVDLRLPNDDRLRFESTCN
jgi:hypothetical protein